MNTKEKVMKRYTPRSSTETIIKAMRILAQDIVSDDYVANAAIMEAADRLDELQAANVLMLEALEAVIANDCDHKMAAEFGGYTLDDEVRDAVIAAIAKVKGEQP